MTEVASEIADAIHQLADEIAGVGGALAYLAAAQHSKNSGEQRMLAAVIHEVSKNRFGGVKYDGLPIDRATVEELDRMWVKLFPKAKK